MLLYAPTHLSSKKCSIAKLLSSLARLYIISFKLISPSKLMEMGMTPDGLPGANFIYNGTFNVSQLWVDISSSSKFITAVSEIDS
jgi:hypothetical protein